MGWQSDWLYDLIFDEVARIWKRAIRDGRGPFGPAPTALVIKEMGEPDWEAVRCQGDVHRLWCYRGGTPEVLPVEPESETGVGEQRGMFYERGEVQFHISSDRKRVLFTYVLGPRNGRGMEFAVQGQGRQGKLVPGTSFWQS